MATYTQLVMVFYPFLTNSDSTTILTQIKTILGAQQNIHCFRKIESPEMLASVKYFPVPPIVNYGHHTHINSHALIPLSSTTEDVRT